MDKKKRHIGRWIAIALAALVAVCAIGFAVYVNDYYHAAPGNEAYTESSADAAVERGEGYLAFGDPDAQAGFILYPGAKVAFDAYAPLLDQLAAEGVFCAVVEVPFNIAFFAPDAAAKVIEAYPNVKSWYVGGHSLGGVVASGWAADHADTLKGVVLLASYPTADLSQSGLRVLSLYGSEDEVLNRRAYDEAAPKLPADFQEVVIEGGNHGQFGNYGEQAGDGRAAISPEEQWEEAARAIAAFIEST
ncbi:alpha/beta hydrolase [Raoultibacter phocaeensis]|uniref:alpha/beta hydrolase n=1 Tax=Raoultibacter phocaeensis TaxID=2479841 RepID=UPI0011185EE5|nr:alpha/beta hydrolase [Raoultibacter phocaeensis]